MNIMNVKQTALGVARGLADADAALVQAGKSADRLPDTPAVRQLVDTGIGNAVAGLRSTIDGAASVGVEQSIGSSARRWTGHAIRELEGQRASLLSGSRSIDDLFESDAMRYLEFARRDAFAHIDELGTQQLRASNSATTATTPSAAAGVSGLAPDGFHDLDTLGNVARARVDDGLYSSRDDVIYAGGSDARTADVSGDAYGIL